jgi:hypothetical protein
MYGKHASETLHTFPEETQIEKHVTFFYGKHG